MQKTTTRNRRRHKRHIMPEIVEYLVISSPGNGLDYGIISDMSASGMCLLTTTPLKRGDRIVLKSKNLAHETALVLWSDTGAFYYKAGLEFA